MSEPASGEAAEYAPPSREAVQLLKSKALLLLRREREIGALRQERSRTEAWLATVHRLSHELQHKHVERLAEDSVAALVDVMTFQVAAVYRYVPERGDFSLVAGKGHVSLTQVVKLPTGQGSFAAKHPRGLFPSAEAEAGMRGVAEALGLGKFFWFLLDTRRGAFLLLAGYSTETEKRALMPPEELAHFELFGTHLGTLLNNASLIEALDQEKSELSESNALLDHSLGKLRESQVELVKSTRLLAEVSRRAGMADIATGVLHNVGNALNSVNVSTSMARERIEALSPRRLKQVAELLRPVAEGQADELSPDRRQKMARYLDELALHWEAEQQALISELDDCRESIDHIKSIVTKQQAYAKTVGVMEPARVTSLVDDALGFVKAPLEQLGIRVERDYHEVAELLLDRHKVLQILVNLLSNAKHALSDAGAENPRLSVSVRSLEGERVVICVEDNGVGVSPENRDKLFTHGFTTKANGHGFGLHTSALAARELGGRLSFESEGPGKGARFALELPMRPKQALLARNDEANDAA